MIIIVGGLGVILAALLGMFLWIYVRLADFATDTDVDQKVRASENRLGARFKQTIAELDLKVRLQPDLEPLERALEKRMDARLDRVEARLTGQIQEGFTDLNFKIAHTVGQITALYEVIAGQSPGKAN